MNYIRNLVGKKNKDQVKHVKHYWKTFCDQYKNMLNQSTAGASHKIMHSYEIKGSLREIVQILIEEDRKNSLMPESLFIFELICAYTKADQPFGFFKLGMTSVIKLMREIK